VIYARWEAMVRACARAMRRIGMCGYMAVHEEDILVYIFESGNKVHRT